MKKLMACVLALSLLLCLTSISFAGGKAGPPILTEGKTVGSAILGTGFGFLVGSVCPPASIIPWIAGLFTFGHINAAVHDACGEDTYVEDSYRELNGAAFPISPVIAVGDLFIPHNGD